MRLRVIAAIMLVVFGGALSACGGIVDPSKNALETMTGTLTQGDFKIHGPFNVSKSGEYTVTLVTLTPALALNFFVSVGLGLSGANGSCQLIATNTTVPGRQALGSTIQSGSYCVEIGDANGLLLPGTTYTYTMQFSHP